jgi:L-lactate dehydrogenase (cytochrome)
MTVEPASTRANRINSDKPCIIKNMTCIEDLQRAARRKVPRAFFGYAEAGSYSGETLRANRADLERVRLRQRVLIDVSARNTSTTILGDSIAGADRHWRTSAWQG